MKKRILAIIPARAGSKGIPGKNLKKLAGKPLIQYTIDAAKKSSLINRIILSSDDDRIISFCRKKGIEVLFKRPKQLAADITPMIEVIKHALGFLQKKEHYRPDYIVLLQPTSPLRTSEDIDAAIKKLINSKADSAVSVIEVPHNFNPYSVMRLKTCFLKPFLPFDEKRNLRQQKPRFYARNGPAVLAFTYGCLTKKKSMYGDKIAFYLMKNKRSLDIDSFADLQIAETILRRKA